MAIDWGDTAWFSETAVEAGEIASAAEARLSVTNNASCPGRAVAESGEGVCDATSRASGAITRGDTALDCETAQGAGECEHAKDDLASVAPGGAGDASPTEAAVGEAGEAVCMVHSRCRSIRRGDAALLSKTGVMFISLVTGMLCSDMAAVEG
jgi:hypothetical protein